MAHWFGELVEYEFQAFQMLLKGPRRDVDVIIVYRTMSEYEISHYPVQAGLKNGSSALDTYREFPISMIAGGGANRQIVPTFLRNWQLVKACFQVQTCEERAVSHGVEDVSDQRYRISQWLYYFVKSPEIPRDAVGAICLFDEVYWRLVGACSRFHDRFLNELFHYLLCRLAFVLSHSSRRFPHGC